MVRLQSALQLKSHQLHRILSGSSDAVIKVVV